MGPGRPSRHRPRRKFWHNRARFPRPCRATWDLITERSHAKVFAIQKAIRDLQPPDLTILRNVHEGWYVEYKSQVVKASALAKSLSAFANTYGGWLFIGVQEQSGDNAVADEFPSIPEVDVDIRYGPHHGGRAHRPPVERKRSS